MQNSILTVKVIEAVLNWAKVDAEKVEMQQKM